MQLNSKHASKVKCSRVVHSKSLRHHTITQCLHGRWWQTKTGNDRRQERIEHLWTIQQELLSCALLIPKEQQQWVSYARDAVSLDWKSRGEEEEEGTCEWFTHTLNTLLQRWFIKEQMSPLRALTESLCAHRLILLTYQQNETMRSILI